MVALCTGTPESIASEAIKVMHRLCNPENAGQYRTEALTREEPVRFRPYEFILLGKISGLDAPSRACPISDNGST